MLVVEGKQQEQIDEENRQKWQDISVEDHLRMLIGEGMLKKEAIKKVAKDRGLQKNDVYKIATNI